MAYFLFIDESGQDHKNSPYEVLAGVAIEAKKVWQLVQGIQSLEKKLFGTRYSQNDRELKGRRVLKKKTFRLARQLESFESGERKALARKCIRDGGNAGKRELTALAQAKIEYVNKLLDECAKCECRFFASIVNPSSPKAEPRHLRKDYAYLFERFFYYLEDQNNDSSGIIVFDELEKSKSHILVDQMDRYFKQTKKGKQRSGKIIPEPFFVHSELTTGIQIADLVAYIISWNLRIGPMRKKGRKELEYFVGKKKKLSYTAIREMNGKENFKVGSFVYINDLRPQEEQGK